MEALKNEAVIKWGVVAASVIAMECIGEQSLTHYAHKAMEHPIGRWIVPAAIGITAMHLMDREHQILPETIDAFHIIAKTVDRIQEWV
jgi:hypothetical protein